MAQLQRSYHCMQRKNGKICGDYTKKSAGSQQGRKRVKNFNQHVLYMHASRLSSAHRHLADVLTQIKFNVVHLIMFMFSSADSKKTCDYYPDKGTLGRNLKITGQLFKSVRSDCDGNRAGVIKSICLHTVQGAFMNSRRRAHWIKQYATTSLLNAIKRSAHTLYDIKPRRQTF